MIAPRFIDAVTGRRGRWLVIAAWIVLAAAGATLHARLPEVTATGQSSFLPADADSTRAADTMQARFGNGDDVPAFVVFARRGGLTCADRAAIGALGKEIDRLGLHGATPAIDPLTKGAGDLIGAAGLGDADRSAAIVAVGIDADVRDAVADDVGRLRALLASRARPGLEQHVTGPAGVAADLEAVAADAGRTLLFATLGLVLILLLAVYRAPILAILPLAVVAAAYLVAAGIAYFLIRSDVIVVNSEGTMLLLVLVFGVGTDYSLLMIHRYRQALADDDDTTRALRGAVAASAPAILASGGTVIAALLVLLFADLESTRWLGPILAIGVAMMLLAAFTLLPGVLAVLGGRAFWLGRRSPPASGGRWTRVADLVRRRSVTVIAVTCAVLAVAALGNLVSTGTIGFGQGESRPTDSSRGTALLDANFPPGLSAPVLVIASDGEAERAARELGKLPEVMAAVPAEPSKSAGLMLVAAVLRDDPYSTRAIDAIGSIRSAVDRVAPGALVGGITAENLDVQDANARDTRVLIPVILVVILIILVVLLRALVAPAYLIATVIASFAATLGFATVVFTKLLDEAGLSFNLTLLAFIFLVTLGVDYNIFLMHRAREEARRLGTPEGTLRALVETGGVVTGAGVILAGTFATLTVLPLDALVQIGWTVAVGVLLDTFLVRALLVPAITYRCGETAWQPDLGAAPHPDAPPP